MTALARPRWFQRLRAWLGGYFWLPCPLCGRKFGGHEWGDGPYTSIANPARGLGAGTAVCPACEGRPETMWQWGIQGSGPSINDVRPWQMPSHITIDRALPPPPESTHPDPGGTVA